MTTVPRAALFAGVALACVGLVFGALAVLGHEREELERLSPPTLLEPTVEADGTHTPHRELVRAEVREGEDVVFEVCAPDQLEPDVWAPAAIELVVWHPEDEEVVVRTPLDREQLTRLRRSPRGACVLLAHGESIPIGGEYAIEAVWAASELPANVRETPLVGRVLAHTPLTGADRWPVWCLLAGAFSIVLGLAGGRTREAPDASAEASAPPARRGLVRVAIGLTALVAVVFGLGLVPIGGATVAFARGLAVALVEIASAVLLVGAAGGAIALSRGARLGLVAPRRWWLLVLMPAFGIVLFVLGGIALRLVPSTAEAPLETLVALPSGSLALALVAVVVPIGEELFFRGFVWSEIERRFGGAAAFGATVGLFALAHLPQDWGAWGALTSILVAGIGFTAIRWWTGSTVACAVAHLAHNAAIVLLSSGGA